MLFRWRFCRIIQGMIEALQLGFTIGMSVPKPGVIGSNITL